LNRLWAPWRMQYIQTCDNTNNGCFLCEAAAAGVGIEKLTLYCDNLTVVVMNLFPYNNGHLLVAPRRHIGGLNDLTADELLAMGEVTRQAVGWLDYVYHPHGYNIGLNLGRVAGAGLPGHLHTHIVPRWNGDSNFMPILGETKVVSESLQEGWRRLREAI